jgi:hypothetical protein
VRLFLSWPDVRSFSQPVVITVPVNSVLAVVLLYFLLGWSSFVGLAVMAVLFPVPSKLGALMGGFEAKRMEAVSY